LNLNKFIQDYLNFSRKDRIGIIVLLSFLLFVFFLPSFKSLLTPRKSIKIDSSWIGFLKKTEEKSQRNSKQDNENFPAAVAEKNDYEYDKNVNSNSALFYFDPNTLSANEWKRLGLRDKTIKTIHNYLNKGGKFRKPEDFQKVYGLKQNEYELLSPYIKIENKKEYSPIEKQAFEKRKEETAYSPHLHYAVVDINMADTTAFIALPGIGSKLAGRIINFREKLGGFYTAEQLKETYGLQDSVFQKIKPYLKLENKSVKKINLNTATKEELKIHPYIKWNIANAIIEYRNQHGNFSNLEDLKKIQAINEDMFTKLVNYITL
jgi:competence protein ComEA